MIIPQFDSEPSMVITPFSLESIGSVLANIQDDISAAGSVSWGTANLVLYVPFVLTAPSMALQMFTMNGSAANGTTHVGIYTEDGTRIVSKSAAQSGTTAFQLFDIDDVVLAPGIYYMAVGSTSTTMTIYRVAPGATAVKALGCFQQTSAIPLPALATFATMATNIIPLVGVAFGSVV